MKRLFFLLICSILCLNLSAQWRRQYIPGDELKGIPSEWSYIYESGNKVVTFTDSGILMIVAKNQYFTTTDEGFVPVLIGSIKMETCSLEENTLLQCFQRVMLAV